MQRQTSSNDTLCWSGTSIFKFRVIAHSTTMSSFIDVESWCLTLVLALEQWQLQKLNVLLWQAYLSVLSRVIRACQLPMDTETVAHLCELF